MDDALGVRGIEGIGNLYGVIEQFVGGHRTAFDGAAEGLAFEEFHDDEAATVLFINIVDRANVRMVQCGSSSRLALETLKRFLVSGELVRKEFQRDLAAEANVLGFIDDTHTAATEFLDNAVMGDSLADHGSRGTHGKRMLGRLHAQVNAQTRYVWS